MIKKIPFFKNLNEQDIKILESISSLKKLNRDEILFFEGESPKFLNILINGSVKIYKTTPKGREVYMRDIKPVNFIAEFANFENIDYPASAVANQYCEIVQIEYKQFVEYLLKDAKLCFNILKSITAKLNCFHQVFEREILMTANQKVAKFIVENQEAVGILKQVQIANYLNLTPETYSRILKDFKQKKLVQSDKNGKIISFSPKLKLLYES